MDEIELEKRLTKLEEAIKSVIRTITNIESMQKQIQELALSINTLANSLQHVDDTVIEQNCRIKEIESKPSKRIDQIITAIIATIIGIAIGIFSKKLIGG